MKYMPGFIPIDFSKSGKILFVLGLACIFLKIVDYLMGWIVISNNVLFFGLALLVIGAYLIFVVPKSKF